MCCKHVSPIHKCCLLFLATVYSAVFHVLAYFCCVESKINNKYNAHFLKKLFFFTLGFKKQNYKKGCYEEYERYLRTLRIIKTIIMSDCDWNLQRINDWKIKNEISSGSFGRVFAVEKNSSRHGRIVAAAKIEKPSASVTQIQYEYNIYLSIKHMIQQTNNEYFFNQFFLKVFDYGEYKHFKYMVMEMAQQDLSKINISQFQTTQLVHIITGMLNSLRAFHMLGFLHRDVKPANYVINQNNQSSKLQIKIIDLGLSKKYINEQGEHIKCEPKSTQVGTLRYSSIYSSDYIQSCRRDDLISFVYTAVNVFGGTLPWQEVPDHIDRISDKKRKKKERQKHVAMMKRILSPMRVMQDIDYRFNKPLQQIYCSALNLRFDEEPPYDQYIYSVSLKK